MADSGMKGSGKLAVILIAAVILAGACNRADSQVTYDEVPDLTLTEVVRIGDEAEGDSLWFEQVGSLAVDSKGRIYASGWSLFRGVHSVRVISNDGIFLHEIGSRGQAPGEFMENPVVWVGLQDTVFVLDVENNRLTVFSPDDHHFIATTRLTRIGPDTEQPQRLLAVTQSNLLIEYEYSPFRAVEEGREAYWQLTLFDRSGQVKKDSVASGPLWEPVEVKNSRGRPVHIPRIFAREAKYAISPNNLIYYGWNEGIVITAVTLEGNAMHEIVVPHPAVRGTAKDVEKEAGPFAEWAAILRQDVHGTKPAYNAMVADDEGQLWLKMSWLEDAPETSWLIIDSETGAVVSKASLPTNAEILVIRDGRAYGYLAVERAITKILIVWEITS